MDWQHFPAADPETLNALQRGIDLGFRGFTRAWGGPLEQWFEPLRVFLLLSERLLTQSPWPLVLAGLVGLAWAASRSWRIAAATLLTLVLVGALGLWDDSMKTLAMIAVATTLAVALGVPLGIAMGSSDRLQRAVNPVLDLMQTLPSFVYLIPVVMLLGIGRVPGLIAVVIYALPPMVRATNLGLRQVDPDLLEAADAFGSSRWQRLWRVQLPLALPTLMAGVNQTIMLALGMVVIAAMIGVQGLGQPVLKAISNQYFAMGLLNGLAIVGIAMLLDRVSQAWGLRLQRHRAPAHG
jgi:glycine betaine/proline transport system permease protein